MAGVLYARNARNGANEGAFRCPVACMGKAAWRTRCEDEDQASLTFCSSKPRSGERLPPICALSGSDLRRLSVRSSAMPKNGNICQQRSDSALSCGSDGAGAGRGNAGGKKRTQRASVKGRQERRRQTSYHQRQQ